MQRSPGLKPFQLGCKVHVISLRYPDRTKFGSKGFSQNRLMPRPQILGSASQRKIEDPWTCGLKRIASSVSRHSESTYNRAVSKLDWIFQLSIVVIYDCSSFCRKSQRVIRNGLHLTPSETARERSSNIIFKTSTKPDRRITIDTEVSVGYDWGFVLVTNLW